MNSKELFYKGLLADKELMYQALKNEIANEEDITRYDIVRLLVLDWVII
jgi:hypothetical protein